MFTLTQCFPENAFLHTNTDITTTQPRLHSINIEVSSNQTSNAVLVKASNSPSLPKHTPHTTDSLPSILLFGVIVGSVCLCTGTVIVHEKLG